MEDLKSFGSLRLILMYSTKNAQLKETVSHMIEILSEII